MKIDADALLSQSGLHTVHYGQQLIRFQLHYARRKTLVIQVHPDGTVVVKAPLPTPLAEVKARVAGRGGWIVKHLRRFASLPPPLPPRRYRSGEGFRYLGRQIRLRVIRGARPAVELHQDCLQVTTRDPEAGERIKAQVKAWYRQQAQAVFAERLAECAELAARHGIPAPASWRLLWMKRRWGSCSRCGHVILNPALIAASKDCIDYVITHELCHLVEHNHSPAYYRLLTRLMPDWRERRRRLNEGAELSFD